MECQDEVIKTKQKLKILDHQVVQLKEENLVQESVLTKEHFDHSKLEKEKEGLQLFVSKLQHQQSDANQTITDQRSEVINFRHTIAEADSKKLKDTREFESIRQEKV